MSSPTTILSRAPENGAENGTEIESVAVDNDGAAAETEPPAKTLSWKGGRNRNPRGRCARIGGGLRCHEVELPNNLVHRLRPDGALDVISLFKTSLDSSSEEGCGGASDVDDATPSSLESRAVADSSSDGSFEHMNIVSTLLHLIRGDAPLTEATDSLESSGCSESSTTRDEEGATPNKIKTSQLSEGESPRSEEMPEHSTVQNGKAAMPPHMPQKIKQTKTTGCRGSGGMPLGEITNVTKSTETIRHSARVDSSDERLKNEADLDNVNVTDDAAPSPRNDSRTPETGSEEGERSDDAPASADEHEASMGQNEGKILGATLKAVQNVKTASLRTGVLVTPVSDRAASRGARGSSSGGEEGGAALGTATISAASGSTGEVELVACMSETPPSLVTPPGTMPPPPLVTPPSLPRRRHYLEATPEEETEFPHTAETPLVCGPVATPEGEGPTRKETAEGVRGIWGGGITVLSLLYGCKQIGRLGWGAVNGNATAIQSRWRTYRARTEYTRAISGAISLQALVRGRSQRREYLQSRRRRRNEGAATIQSRWRAWIAHTDYAFATWGIVRIQSVFRSRLRVREYRRERQERRVAFEGAARIQACWRGYRALVEYACVISSVIAFQSLIRRRPHLRRHMLVPGRRANAAVTIQSAFRSHMHRAECTKKVVSTTVIQSCFRMLRAMRERRHLTIRRGQCATKIQAAWRRHIVSERIILENKAVAAIQRCFRGSLGFQMFALNNRSAIQIQARLRGHSAKCFLTRLKQKKRERMRNEAATIIQSCFRGYHICICYSTTVFFAIKIQTWARGNNARCHAQRLNTRLVQDPAATIIQSCFRGYTCFVRFAMMQYFITRIQTCVRGHQAKCSLKRLKRRDTVEKMRKEKQLFVMKATPKIGNHVPSECHLTHQMSNYYSSLGSKATSQNDAPSSKTECGVTKMTSAMADTTEQFLTWLVSNYNLCDGARAIDDLLPIEQKEK